MKQHFAQQTNYTCGSASMRIALAQLGINVSEKKMEAMLKTNKIRGTWHKAFPIVAEHYKLNYMVSRNSTLQALKDALQQGYTIIVCYLYPPQKVDHYAVINNIGRTYIYFLDPFWGRHHRHSIAHFTKIWKSDPKYEHQQSWFIGIKK
ncbi:MAG: C39 family peptidase [Candidatus Woesearchaeota archaeon]